MSSEVNEAIKTISSQFFLRKDLEHAKSIKAQITNFPPLRRFHARKNVVFVVFVCFFYFFGCFWLDLRFFTLKIFP